MLLESDRWKVGSRSAYSVETGKCRIRKQIAHSTSLKVRSSDGFREKINRRWYTGQKILEPK